MNNHEKIDIQKISEHVAVLNDELGKVKIDIKWLKRIMGYMAVIITGVFIAVAGGVIKYVFLGG